MEESEQTMLCGGIVIVATAAAILILLLKEGRATSAAIYRDDLWKPSCHAIHPLFLLGFRCFAFAYATTILALDVFYSSFAVFYYYTQWSFLLLIVYFGMSSFLSARAFFRSRLSRYTPSGEDNSMASLLKGYKSGTYGDVEQNMSNVIATLQMYWDTVFAETQEIASVTGCMTQIIFQTLAGAVVLTDLVYWLGIFPLLKELPRAYDFLEINLHGVNFVLIVIDIFLNRMSFPWFRGAYFTLWTGAYVIFQWSVHALGGVQWWPYPFLDPTFNLAPLWYGGLCAGHVVCYGFMCLVVRLKQCLLGYYATR